MAIFQQLGAGRFPWSLCLWRDSVSKGTKFLRTEWMLCVPTICPIHAVPVEDRCESCGSWHFPTLRVLVERLRLRPLPRRTQPRAAALDRAREDLLTK